MESTPITDWRAQAPLDLSPILTAALSAFVEHGFHGASVREIAQRANLTVPALYYHHASKEGLLLEVLLQTVTPIAEYAEAADAAGTDPLGRLDNVVECIALWMTRQSASAVVDSAESRYLNGEARSTYVSVRARIEVVARTIIADGVAAGLFHVDDVAEAARALLGMMQAIPRWYQPEGPETPEQVAASYVVLARNLVRASA